MSILDEFSGSTTEGLAKNPAYFSTQVSYLKKSDVKFFKPEKDKQQQIRIITRPSVGAFNLAFRVHYQVGFEKHSLLCLTNKGETCPLCELYRKYQMQANEAMAKKYKYSNMNSMFVIDRKNESLGPVIWMVSSGKAMKALMELRNDPVTGSPTRNFDSVKFGYDVFFKKEEDGSMIDGKKIAPITSLQLHPQPTPLHSDEKVMIKWLEFIKKNPIESLFNYVTAAEMLKLADLDEMTVETESYDGLASAEQSLLDSFESELSTIDQETSVNEADLGIVTSEVEVPTPEPVKTLVSASTAKATTKLTKEELERKVAAMRAGKQ